MQLTVNEYRAKIYEIMSTTTTATTTTAVAASEKTGLGSKTRNSTTTLTKAGNFKTKAKKFTSASTLNGSRISLANEAATPAVEEKGDRVVVVRQSPEDYNCPFEGQSKSTNGYKLKAHQQHHHHLPTATDYQSYGSKMRNKLACIPIIADAAAAANQKLRMGSTVAATKGSNHNNRYGHSPPANGAILPRNNDVMVARLNNNSNKTEMGRAGGGKGGCGGGGGGKGMTAAEGLPQRCYENRLKVLEDKIRRHKQEMVDFLRVGSNNKKLASIQAAKSTSAMAHHHQPPTTMPSAGMYGKLGDGLIYGNGGGEGGGGMRRIESKLSCSSSSSSQSLKAVHHHHSHHHLIQNQQQQLNRKPFRCPCKPSPATTTSGLGMTTHKGLMMQQQHPDSKLFTKSHSSSTLNGCGVISASDLYKLRSAEIATHN